MLMTKPRSLAPAVSSLRSLFAPLLTMALTFLPLLASAQEEGEAPAGEEVAEEGHSVIDIIIHGGPLIIMIWILIVLISIVMVTLIVQNAFTLRKNKLAPPELVETLRSSMADGNYQEAWEVCEANPCYLSNVLKSGLERLGRGQSVAENAILASAAYESQRLKSRNSYLSVIGVISPMVGLLGTVIGMMGAFAKLGASGVSDPRGLAMSISEVLLATASGLFLAIPAFIFYYIFRNMAQDAVVYSDDIINSFVEDIPFTELEGVRVGPDYSAVE
jgi:biopolymer transport protein ExbB